MSHPRRQSAPYGNVELCFAMYRRDCLEDAETQILNPDLVFPVPRAEFNWTSDCGHCWSGKA